MSKLNCVDCPFPAMARRVELCCDAATAKRSLWVHFLDHENSPVNGRKREVTMKTPLVMVLVAVVLVTVCTLAVMNKACKNSQQHPWCAPMSSLRHHIKTGHS
jgi:hypothetical protein